MDDARRIPDTTTSSTQPHRPISVQVFYYFAFCFQRLMFDWKDQHKSIDSWRMFVLQFAIWFRLLVSLADYSFPALMGRQETLMVSAVALVVGVSVHLLISRERVYEKYARRFRRWSGTQRLLANVAVVAFSAIALISPVIERAILYERPWWS
jgi:hypothetical protein